MKHRFVSRSKGYGQKLKKNVELRVLYQNLL